MARRKFRRPRVATVVFVEVVLAVIIAGVATLTIPGYVVAGVAFVVGVAAFVRRRGRGLADIVRDRLRDPRDEPGTPEAADSVFDGSFRDVGAPLRLLPRLHVTDVETRRAGRIGVVGDGQGFAVVLDAAISASRTWQFSEIVAQVLEDPARPAAVQLLVEQRSARRAAGGTSFAPGRTYRALPTAGIPLWNRALVVIRHEPSWAPETVAVRGDGAIGARSALTAAATRLAAASARDGVALRPMGAAALAGLFRDVGDPGPDCEAREQAWTTSTACHGVVSIMIEDDQTLGTLLEATAELDVDRCVVSLAVSAVDHTVCAALRVVAPDLEHVEAAVEDLIERGLAGPLAGAQEAGVIATLPLGGGARSLAELVNQVRR